MRLRLRRPMESFEGRHIGCAPGTHAALCALIERFVPRECRGSALDLGAHSGALLLRLGHLGYDHLEGADLDSTRFDVPEGGFTQANVNQPFAQLFERTFDLVTATDVIEHMDDPRAFLSEARKLVGDEGKGYLGLTFPNVAFFEGRMKFLVRGELWGFGEKNYRMQRHISPITFEQMALMMQELGWRLIACATAGSFATPLRWVLTAPLWMPLRLAAGPTTLGESAVFLASSSEPDSALKQPTHYRARWAGQPDRIGLDTE
jgi:SAM-dependent methyltransferase